MRIKKLKISILVVVLIALPLIFGGCSFGDFSLFSCEGGGTEYGITYVLNADDVTFEDGEVNPETYWSSASKYLYSPKCDGYVFLGWYDNPDFSGWAWTNIPKGTNGELTLYAKWGEEGEAVCWEGFIPYKEKFDSAKRATTLSIDNRDMLAAYLEYVQYNYIKYDINGVRIKLNYPYVSMERELNAVHNALTYSSYLGIRYKNSSATAIGISNENLITGEASVTAARQNYYRQINPYEYTTEGSAHDFAIDGIETELECSTSNQLFYAAQVGVKPVPEAGSAAEWIYEEARDALTEAVNEDMTDAEKVTAIFEWLVMNVTYDNDVLVYTDDVSKAAEYDAFYLEGVFGDTHRAVCDGISKAMTLMCRIEGIPCVRVTGSGHAWNKVFVDGRWYVTDATFGDTGIAMSRVNYSFMNRRYLLTTENAADAYKNAVNYTSDNYRASVDYGYYSRKKFTYNDKEYSFVITSKEEYNAMYNWANGLGRTAYSVDFYIDNTSWIPSRVSRTDSDNYVTIFFNM